MAFRSARGEAVLAQINITPLIDVMLVLLIIFMIAAPLLVQRIELTLPQIPPTPPPPVETTLRLHIDAAGGYLLDGEALSRSGLAARLAAAERAAVLQVEADPDADYQALAAALAEARNAGLDRIGFVER